MLKFKNFNVFMVVNLFVNWGLFLGKNCMIIRYIYG